MAVGKVQELMHNLRLILLDPLQAFSPGGHCELESTRDQVCTQDERWIALNVRLESRNFSSAMFYFSSWTLSHAAGATRS